MVTAAKTFKTISRCRATPARRLLLSAADTALETQLELQAQALTRVSRTTDAREGMAAFSGKRKPAFTGH